MTVSTSLGKKSEVQSKSPISIFDDLYDIGTWMQRLRIWCHFDLSLLVGFLYVFLFLGLLLLQRIACAVLEAREPVSLMREATCQEKLRRD